MEANARNVQVKLPRSSQQQRGGLSRGPELLPKLDQRITVAGKDSQNQLRVGVIRLDRVQLVEVVKRRVRDAHAAGEHQRRGRLAGVREDNARGVDAQAEDALELRDGGAVEPGAQFTEQLEEGWVGIAFHRWHRSKRGF